jgi:hypothetical protein
MAAKKATAKRAPTVRWTRFTHRKSQPGIPFVYEVSPLKGGGWQARKKQMSGKWFKLPRDRGLRAAKDEWAALDAALEAMAFGAFFGPRLVRADWTKS